MVLKIETFLFTIFFGILASCDCVQYQEGVIIDSKTKEPIEGVEIFKETRPEQKFFSNSCGYYEWDGISGGLLPKCPEPKLYFIHPSYDTLFDPENLNVIRMHRK